MIADPVFKLLTVIIFYGAIVLLSLFSMLTIYIYLRYGQSKIFASFVCIAYILLFVGMITNAQRLFTSLTS
jgi:hypothetical protein